VTPELVIVGAGPCGVSAALWAKSLGLESLLLERGARAGGQLLNVHFVPTNVAAAATLVGTSLAARLGEQLAEMGIDVRYQADVAAIEDGPTLRLSDGTRVEAQAVLIASGVRRRHLGVPGERELEGLGVTYSATQDRAALAGEDVAVVGGGDAAFENALLLSAAGCRVTLVVRATPRARPDFRDRVAADPRIEVLEHTRVITIEGEGQVEQVVVMGDRGRFPLPVGGVVVKVGVLPNSEWCAGAIDRDAEGYVKVDESFTTSRTRVWAAGDVTRPPLFGIAVAAGQGALAVAAIRAALLG
jgi:thioredoxin reductase (NADPH)